jgi:hypothetical protein
MFVKWLMVAIKQCYSYKNTTVDDSNLLTNADKIKIYYGKKWFR